jgi:uncharacterized membrane protein YbhN (UPF0104 family)
MNRPRRLPRWLAWVPGLVVLTALVWLVATHAAEERQFAALLAGARPWWILAGVGFQAATYFTTGQVWQVPLAATGHRLPRLPLVRLALVKLTIDQAVPTGGMSGTLTVARRLRDMGVPSEAVGNALMVAIVSYYLAFSTAVFASLAILWWYHDLHPAVATIASVVGILAAAVPLTVSWLLASRRWRPPALLQRLPWVGSLVAETSDLRWRLARRRRVVLICAATALATILLDAATLSAMLLALGAQPAPLACLAALVMAQVAATLGLVPGGLGTFEAGSIATLTLTGTSSAAALGATLLLRGLSFWLPMIPGLVFMRRSGRRAGDHRGRATAPPR